LLIPVTGDGTLQAVIGLVVPVDGPQLSPEDIEDVRKLAVEAAPVLMRLQEIEQLRRQNHELASSAERTKHAEESLAVLLEERNALDAIIRMRSHLHANVAHDLRTPLGTIRGYARMILDGRTGEINDTQRKYLQIVTDNTNRLIALIGWMGYIADLNAQHLDLSTFDLRDVWSECVVASWQRLSEESLKLTEQIPDETFVTVGDRKQLARAFNELIAAAMQYSEPGGTITAEFGHGRDREVTVKISAKGAAIPANILSETFERSFTTIARPAAQDTNGDAINLSDVYSVVGMHGGRFFVNSVAAQGASFLFTLPAVLDDGEENNHEQPVNSSRRRR
jgi:signal transduction histidine kinase